MYRSAKRFFDFIFALILIILILPFLLPIMIGLLLTGEGYVFYLQKRVGFKNRIFKIWKFATMLKDSPNMKGGIITLRNDPRITPMGGFLRITKINEVPQLINVLRGEMSFVGPRPVVPLSFEQYPEEVRKLIYQVTPGITGIGSIVFRDEEKVMTEVKESGMDPWAYYRDFIYPYKGELEKWYQQNQSLVVDLKILVLTALTILFPDHNLTYKVFRGLPERSFTVPSLKQHTPVF